MDNGTYLLVLILGTALVAVDGQLVYRSGLRFLADSYGDRHSAAAMARMVSALFHLAVLGVLAIISTIDVPADTVVEAVVIRMGVVLLVLAAAHGVAIAALTRIRDRMEYEDVANHRLRHAEESQRVHRDATLVTDRVERRSDGYGVA